ncbi:unnamed protein product [Ilex paraguariensis]|uniref:Uncharacterized protein n=1 Tax=Ilex paraguariensis TaxID=185542 RepID=A0ABC8TX35_9AQUA
MLTLPTHPQPPYPKLESLTYIDIGKLSQSELQALSLCSDSAFDLRGTDDVVIPQINRSIFNESAGSRKQTYSRLRSSSAAGHPPPPLPGLLPSPRPPPSIDPENKFIINSLKQLIGEEPISNSQRNDREIVHVNSDRHVVSNTQVLPIVQHSGVLVKKRKRDRKSKGNMLLENGVRIELDIVNKNGVAVDLEALANSDDLYGAELRKRTMGLNNEAEVLGFLSGLEGQWGSRRKKRRIVDASEFGDALPISWKLLLGLKRREGRVSVYCRRYISPTGQQFVSCKEVSAFLQSHFGLNDASQPTDLMATSIHQAHKVASHSQHAGFIHNDDDIRHDMISNSTLASSSLSGAHENEVSLVEIGNLAEVQVRDIFDCYKCNLTFDEKNDYLQHLMSYHQKTTRRYRLGKSVGDGVIIKDGKYECQFCHKVFQERRSYNGHVGIHVRNYVRGSEELLAPVTAQKSSEDGLPSRISKMDALIEIAQNSILETSSPGPTDKPNSGSSLTKLNVEQMSAAHTDDEVNLGSGHSEMELEDCIANRALDQELNQYDSKYAITDGEVMKFGDTWDFENVNVGCTNNLDHPKLDEEENCGNIQVETGFENRHVKPNHNVIEDRVGQTIEENILQNGVADVSVPHVQSSICFPAFNAVSNKGENEYGTSQKLDNITGFEELKLDEIEPFQYSFVNEQEPHSLPEVSMDLANDAGIEEGFNSSVRFESEAVMFNMDDRHQVTTLCVWCRTEFNHEAIDSEAQSDSIGFMCPTCKAKISGHLNCGLSMNAHSF